MTRKHLALALLCLLIIAASAQAAVVTIVPGTKITPDGVEPAEWQLTSGWSIVTNKMGLGKIMASGPSVCETPYSPFVAYQLTNAASSGQFPRWYIASQSAIKQDMGRGAFYASCSTDSGTTPSSVWLGTDQHGGRSLAGVKLSQIQKMTYYALVTGVPSWLSPGSSDFGWDSWKSGWFNPRYPIMLTLTVEGPLGRRQLWYRPWGDHTTIGDQASDGRLSVWEQYNCMTYGRWFCPGDNESDNPSQFENWTSVVATYGDYTLVATTTGYDPANGQWKSPGYTNSTTPPGRPACTATGKCLNFWVGARYSVLKRPDTFEYKTWYPESMGFRGQMDYFEFAVNYGTPQSPDVVDVAYNFEPSPDDHGPRFVYLNQANLRDGTGIDTLLKSRSEEHLYDVLYKVSGRVTARSNPYSAFDDGASLAYPTRVYTVLQNRWEVPTNSMALGQNWSSWGLLERFRAVGNPPYTTKPYIVWTSKTHNLKLQ